MRVVVADDAVLLRTGVVRILADDGFDVVGAAGDVDGLLSCIAAERPDLAVIDVRMPPTFTDEGIRAAHEIRGTYPGVAVLMLSQYVHAGGALALFSADARGLGYLLKDRVLEIEEFLGAARRVGAGGTVIDPTVVKALVTPSGNGPLDTLTAREREVLSLMAEGLSNNAIATRLVLSPRTIETHVNGLFSKLGLHPTPDEHRRVRAVVSYLQGVRTSDTWL